MLGTRGIWHKGWFANTVHAATPAGWSHFDKDRWELYHIEADRSQCHDLAADNPDKLEETEEAVVRGGREVQRPSARRPQHPGDDDAIPARTWRASGRASPTTRTRPRSAWAPPPNLAVSRYRVLAEVTVDTTGAEGVLFKQGGAHGGHVLFIQDGRLHYVYNFMGDEEQTVSSSGAVPLGKHIFGVSYSRTGTVENSHTPLGDVDPVHRRRRRRPLPNVKAHPGTFGLAGATISVGRNTGSRGVQYVQGSLSLHRRHHRAGQRRPIGGAVCRRRERTRPGLLQRLMMER